MENLGILRILTCGSVDNGKSTLVGRLLFFALGQGYFKLTFSTSGRLRDEPPTMNV